jgi:hypothetical protein
MNTNVWLPVIVIAAVAGVCAGCANPSLESESEELRADLAGLPGVTSAKLEYTTPVPLDSGKLDLRVKMRDTATPDQVVAVTETAYSAFSTTHHGEEADLSIRAGQTTVALRSFEPDASVAAVGKGVRTGLMATPAAGSVAIDLTTQDVSKGDHVAGTYVVTLPERSTFADVPDLLDSLAAQQPTNGLIGWGGAAADGTSLSYNRGFPPKQLVSRWERLQAAGLPLAVRAFDDRWLFAKGQLTRRYDLDDPAERRELDRIIHRQLRVLGEGEWAYDLLGPRGARLVSIDRYLCDAGSENPYDHELEAWVISEFGTCDPP